MKKGRVKITKNQLRRLTFIKNELEYLLLKSLYRDIHTPKLKRSLIIHRLRRLSSYLAKTRNFCLLTNRGRGTWRIANLSRHKLNHIINEGYFVNYTAFNNR